MAILLFIVFGTVIGLVARAIMPGEQKGDLLMADVLGIAGSFTGVFVTNLAAGHQAMHFHAAGLAGNAIGALFVLFVAGGLLRRRALA